MKSTRMGNVTTATATVARVTTMATTMVMSVRGELEPDMVVVVKLPAMAERQELSMVP
jgi:hypothetical protein